MGGGGGTPPPAPDPYVTAAAQSQANDAAVKAAYKYASIDTNAPWGSTAYTRDSEGMPIAQVTTLGPNEQQYYNTSGALTNALAGKASTLANYIPTNQLSFAGLPQSISGLDYGSLSGISDPSLRMSYNTSGLPNLPGINDFSADRQAVTDAVYNRQKSLLDPELKTQRDQLRQGLADRGITEGSELYNKEWDRLDRSQGETLSRLSDQATLAGSNEQSRLFGLSQSARNQLLGERSNLASFENTSATQLFALQQQLRAQGLSEQQVNAQMANYARQQGINETLTQRNQPFNEMSALIQGSPAMQMPQAPGLPQFGVNPTDIGGYISNNYGQQMQGYQAKQAAKSNTASGAGAAGAATIGLIAL